MDYHQQQKKDHEADTRENKEKKKESPLEDDEIPFKELPAPEKCKSVVITLVKICCFLTCLYVFICSLGLLESAFQLIGGKTAGEAFSSGVLSNPLAGLMIGVLATVLMQSSSTSTSIVVTMVGSGVIPIKKAVPIVMGANIGTSVTSTFVSLAQAGNRDQFRRAFAGATVQDMFNWMAVLILLPVEVAFGYLHWLSGVLVDSMGLQGNKDDAPDMLKAITEPLLNIIVQVNKDIIEEVAHNSNKSDGNVLHRWCKREEVSVNKTFHTHDVKTINCTSELQTSQFYNICQAVVKDQSYDPQKVSIILGWNHIKAINETHNLERCDNLFAKTDLDDVAVGVILLIASLVLMLAALMLIVKILNSMLSGSVNKVIKKTINADLPGPFAYFTGYLAILVGCGMTIVVQSSSIFTSTLTPLVGLGIVEVERMYPMTLGSNIGTTVTAILAALSQSGMKLENSIRIAMCHLFFNLTGMLIFYPIPFMRVPIGMAKTLGNTTAKHRWFAIFYIILMFIILPGVTFALSYAGWIYLAAIGGPIFIFLLTILVINVLQRKRPHWLPNSWRNWNSLPEWMHSLKPVDRLIARIFRCAYCQNLQQRGEDDEQFEKIQDDECCEDRDTDVSGVLNIGYESDKDIEMATKSKVNHSNTNGHVIVSKSSKSDKVKNVKINMVDISNTHL